MCFSAVNFIWHRTHTKPCRVPNIFRLHNTFFKSYWNKQNSFCLNCIYVSKENTGLSIFAILTHLFLHFSIYRENSRWVSELIITLNCASWEWHIILSYYFNFPKERVERSWKTLYPCDGLAQEVMVRSILFSLDPALSRIEVRNRCSTDQIWPTNLLCLVHTMFFVWFKFLSVPLNVLHNHHYSLPTACFSLYTIYWSLCVVFLSVCLLVWLFASQSLVRV